MSVISRDLVAAVRGTAWQSEPYAWALIESVTSPALAERLAATLPNDGFITGERSTGIPGHSKPYRLETRLLNVGDEEAFPPEWREFLVALRSQKYRQAMSDASGINLHGVELELSFWRYPPGGWLGPHTDKHDKVVTQIFYLNPEWDPNWGGCLRILGSEHEEDVIMEIPPVLNSSVVLVRSDKSWHMVTKTEPSESTHRVRHVLTAMFRRKTA